MKKISKWFINNGHNYSCYISKINCTKQLKIKSLELIYKLYINKKEK